MASFSSTPSIPIDMDIVNLYGVSSSSLTSRKLKKKHNHHHQQQHQPDIPNVRSRDILFSIPYSSTHTPSPSSSHLFPRTQTQIPLTMKIASLEASLAQIEAARGDSEVCPALFSRQMRDAIFSGIFEPLKRVGDDVDKLGEVLRSMIKNCDESDSDLESNSNSNYNSNSDSYYDSNDDSDSDTDSNSNSNSSHDDQNLDNISDEEKISLSALLLAVETLSSPTSPTASTISALDSALPHNSHLTQAQAQTQTQVVTLTKANTQLKILFKSIKLSKHMLLHSPPPPLLSSILPNLLNIAHLVHLNLHLARTASSQTQIIKTRDLHGDLENSWMACLLTLAVLVRGGGGHAIQELSKICYEIAKVVVSDEQIVGKMLLEASSSVSASTWGRLEIPSVRLVRGGSVTTAATTAATVTATATTQPSEEEIDHTNHSMNVRQLAVEPIVAHLHLVSSCWFKCLNIAVSEGGGDEKNQNKKSGRLFAKGSAFVVSFLLEGIRQCRSFLSGNGSGDDEREGNLRLKVVVRELLQDEQLLGLALPFSSCFDN